MADGVETTPPKVTILSWEAMVRKMWGDQWNEKDIVYEFSNGKKFKSTDTTDRGIYDGE